MRPRGPRGFTTQEPWVPLVILAILAVITVVTFRNSYRAQRRRAATAAELDRVRRRWRAVPTDAFAADSFSRRGLTVRYRLLAPAAPEPGRRYPLVLMLHGSGAIGTRNRAQLGDLARSWADSALRARYPAWVLVPQFPSRSADDHDDPDDGRPASRGTVALEAALALVDSLRGLPGVDTTRLYVVGFAMGGSAAWQALVLRPGRFAAAVPIGGVPPERRLAPRLAGTPIRIEHGDDDEDTPLAAARAMAEALRRAGDSAVVLDVHRGLGHEVPPALYLDQAWRDWLFAQRRSNGPPPPGQ